MRYSLGFPLQKDVCIQLWSIVNEVTMIFRGQGIPVRWSDQKDYHISLHCYYKLPFIQKSILEGKLKKITIPTSTISLHRLKLGDSKRMKGLMYFSIDSGGEYLRNLKSEIVKMMNIKGSFVFVPHIVIGRVSKDITKQEYSNLVKDLESLQERTSKVQFQIGNLELIEF